MNPMKLPPLNALRVFVAAAEHLSFTRAAAALHLTQGAVSRHVQTLEEFYGTSLFIRQARGLALTAEGEALVKPARDAFQLLHEASEMLRLRQSGLRVRIPPTPAMRWVLPNLPDFQTRYPEYTLHLITQLIHDKPFNRAEYDLAIIGMPRPEVYTDMRIECICREKLVPVCSPSLMVGPHPLRTPEDLQYHTLLHPWRDQDVWDRWLKLAGVSNINPESGVTFDALEYALHAAAAGMGVTLAQVSMVNDDIQRGRLVIPFDTVLETEWAYYLMYSHEMAQQPKIRAFRDWLIATLERSEAISRTM
ncbi:glycine cleavage system transcriptional activator GcvA [Aquitalea magnusonii]|uniref:Glycine cleavage system transcriptional activator GcvA n=1 Tax=Aquitalea magnusonii TaxID=332411 RepID=A0A3G9GVC7_9NEIS|nr:LysR substrate-binding domain-containing protein [Aquitalea magnusonii]BBF87626.1 glycine cleavage system transcriptional activator GcvA [Aquitalea magnusonii]